jgi:hypothetical protein
MIEKRHLFISSQTVICTFVLRDPVSRGREKKNIDLGKGANV